MFEPNLSCHLSLRSTPEPHKDAFYLPFYIFCTQMLYLNCKIIKYVDDAIVISLISDNNEDEYRQTISYVSDWGSENYLDLNVTKMKEIILDMRKKPNSKTPVTISNSSVAIVSSYKYLGVIIQDNL